MYDFKRLQDAVFLIKGVKMNFNFFSKKINSKNIAKEDIVEIPRSELREFLMNNKLEGELNKRVTQVKANNPGISNYEAVEYILDSVSIR